MHYDNNIMSCAVKRIHVLNHSTIILFYALQQVCPSRVLPNLQCSDQLHSGVHGLPHSFTQSESGCRGDEYWGPASHIQTGRFVPGYGTGSQCYGITT